MSGYYFAKNKCGTISCFTEIENPKLNEDSGMWEASTQIIYFCNPSTIIPEEVWDRVREFLKDIDYSESLHEVETKVTLSKPGYKVDIIDILFHKR